MLDNTRESDNNQIFLGSCKVEISGILENDFEYSHTTFDRKFYKSNVLVMRLSGNVDNVPVVIPEELLPIGSVCKQIIGLSGEIRTCLLTEEGVKHRKIYVFAEEIYMYDNISSTRENLDVNKVCICGTINSQPIYRLTPKRTPITEIPVCITTKYDKYNIIHCIAWKKLALLTSKMKKGDKFYALGRFQSRKYYKVNPENPQEGEWKETYEISINKIINP